MRTSPLFYHSTADVITNSSSELFMFVLERPSVEFFADLWEKVLYGKFEKDYHKLKYFIGFEDFLAYTLSSSLITKEDFQALLVPLGIPPLPEDQHLDTAEERAVQEWVARSMMSETERQQTRGTLAQELSKSHATRAARQARLLPHLLAHRELIEPALPNLVFYNTDDYTTGFEKQIENIFGQEPRQEFCAGWRNLTPEEEEEFDSLTEKFTGDDV